MSIKAEIKDQKNLKTFHDRGQVVGTYTSSIYHHDLCFPVAIVWYRFTENATAIDLLNIHTDDWYRRCGLMKKLIDDLLLAYPTVRKLTTDAGTKTGAAFMKSYGFVKSRNGTGWTLLTKKVK